MIPRDGREIVFAGAGVLWGVTTFLRGLREWRESTRFHSSGAWTVHVVSAGKSSVPSSIVTGLLLTVACSAYLAWAFLNPPR